MEIREKWAKFVAPLGRLAERLSTSFGLGYFLVVVLLSLLPATVALTFAWNYAIVGMFILTAGVTFLEMFVLLACVWVITLSYVFIQAYNRLRIFQWQTKGVQESMGQQTQAATGLMKHFNRGDPT